MPSAALILLILCFLFPVFNYMTIPLFDGYLVKGVEAIQALMLLAFAIFTYLYMQPLQRVSGQKQFWLWAVLWWVLLFGRSTSWGRDYFPEVPKPYFRAISVCLIAPVVFMLGSKALRQEIAKKARHMTVPVWAMALTLIGLVISDSIEHTRMLSMFFVLDTHYKDLLEELYEFPLIVGLFLVAYHFMQQDRSQQD
ncbi:hypothetical protein A3K93_08315 [Acinetobacter sp. NCu2D-2]|nr:hypothetical protein A3K93_08315 [Acinetobacter sp. NCu2D-2]